MANSKRLNKNRNGQMLIPMNVDGGVFEDGFFTSTKVCALIALLLFTGGIMLWASNMYLSIIGKILLGIIVILIDQLVLRYIVFEEKYYYKMYKKMKQFEVSTPAVFWNIVSMKETDEGTIMCYGDGKIGILVKVERDTIIGKSAEFKETHYDAVSDFYKELNLKEFKFVQMNLMEQAGKDPRLQKLNELVRKTDNKNISKIVEAQVGYIKKITRATLFESDYFLIYTEDINSTDTIIGDALDCVYKLLGGAYISYQVCDTTEILEVLKEQYGIKYFDYTDAVTNMYRNLGANISKTYDIYEIKYTDGTSDEVDKNGNNRLINLTSCVNKGTLKFGEWSIKEALKGNLKNENKKVKKTNRGTSLDEIIEDSSKNNGVDLDDELFSGSNRQHDVVVEMDKDNIYGYSIDKNKNIENEMKKEIEHSDIHYTKKDDSNISNNQQNNDNKNSDGNLYLEDDEVIDLS